MVCSQQSVWQYGRVKNIKSAFCSIININSNQGIKLGVRINNEHLTINSTTARPDGFQIPPYRQAVYVMRHLSIMMQEVFKEIEEYVLEKDRKRVEHVRFVIPGHNFQLLIMDSIKLLIDPDFRNDTSAIYFSINGKTKKGKRIIEIAEYCELFASYDVSIGGINYTRIKRFNLDPIELSNEIIRILMVLFPTLDLRDINVTLIRRDSWTTLHS